MSTLNHQASADPKDHDARLWGLAYLYYHYVDLLQRLGIADEKPFFVVNWIHPGRKK